MNTSLQGPVGALTQINGRTYDYFGGCGYLGLQSQPQVLQAAADAVLRYGLSTANSRGGLGESPLYTDMEEAACTFFACEKVLTFASGYLGAAVLIQGEGQANDHFFIDADAHFSLWDAAAASNHAITPFAHCRPEALQAALQHELAAGERAVVLSDGLFPISGEVAPLPDYLEVLRNLPARLIVDDAHGAGVLGEHGRGTLEFWGITDERVSVSATFNKALGGFGGLVYGRRQALEHLERNSRVLAGSSPLP
ncbi:MAG: pyridoxal phosphate-dependent aminotransferase family protein, partial [Anaerolineaceae bacterium]|nr:pyridoxal phosphate-dependent aminotransferase family protein [Anaerolineaceae bacterium]